MPTSTEHPRCAELLTALSALGLEEQCDRWLVDNGTNWKLRWIDHTTPEQHVKGNELMNALLNN